MQNQEPQGLIIDLERLNSDGEIFTGEIPLEVLDYDPDDYLFTPVTGINYKLFVQQIGSELLVRGSIWEEFSCMCVRCTENFTWIAEDNELTFSLEILENSFFDLTNELRECIIIQYPSNPVCDENCKGLCPRCGTNLNKQQCSCKPDGDDRWGGLDDLKTE